MRTHIIDKTTRKPIVNPTATHAIVYVGAPYGDNEGGHIVKVAASRDDAWKLLDRMGDLKALEHRIVPLDKTNVGSRWTDETTTAREYFNIA